MPLPSTMTAGISRRLGAARRTPAESRLSNPLFVSAASRVREIQRAVRQWGQQPKASRKMLCTARPNWLSLSTTFFRKDQCHKIPVPLYDILSLDEDNMTVR